MEPVTSVLYTLFRGTPRHAEWVLSCLEGAWPGIIGDRLAGICRPVSLVDNTLTIEVEDEAWLPALASMREEFRRKLEVATGDVVRNLRFVAAPQAQHFQ